MGELIRISGPVVQATKMKGAMMYDLVRVGEAKLLGEVIQLRGDTVTIQVYEDTSGLKPGDIVENTGEPLSMELGPGLLTSIYDGVQRPLKLLTEASGHFMKSGVIAYPLDRKRKWAFTPAVKKGDLVVVGDILGEVQETHAIKHRILSASEGEVAEVAAGEYTIEETVCRIMSKGKTLAQTMLSRWDVRRPRPYRRKLEPTVPLVTGQRVIDTFFPIAKGGTAAIPGPFGSGKSVMQQALTRFSDAQVVIYIGCGERGNEMTDVLTKFRELEDPLSKRPLLERTILVANTSNMPVAAREASIYSGITMAEYYRDMGYDVALMADSISRWAEAMREISSRLEEMPGEEGYPAYLGRRLAEFYERAGRVVCLGGGDRTGSVTVISAVSPPGGDISEPVSQNTLRIVKVFLALDADLAHRRHFPAINWLKSYSLYLKTLKGWFTEHVSKSWYDVQARAMQLLQKEAELKDIVQLVGPDTIPVKEQNVLQTAKMLREDFLQQDSFSSVDAYTSLRKQNLILSAIVRFHEKADHAIDAGVGMDAINRMKCKVDIAGLRGTAEEKLPGQEALHGLIDREFEKLIGGAKDD